ncbi:MAG: hypothetical protein M1817_003010 [Caeruleum heppii]|nr:MAG: hypothetical protein M1817_003010 [Caeruleum heppii]
MNLPRDTLDDPPPIHDVAIVGAGPCGLAVAARLCERVPSALFTESELRRYHWLARHVGATNILNGRRRQGTTKRKTPNRGHHPYSMRVFDSSGDEWITRWRRNFEVLRISHLRSPLFFHVDPWERDALLGFAYEAGREGELREISGVVGKEVSKHRRKMRRDGKRESSGEEINERQRKDYFTPSAALFEDHCRAVVERYGLADVVERAEVRIISYGAIDGLEAEGDLFTLQTSNGRCYARTVVLAVGAQPAMPFSPDPEYCCHSSQLGDNLFPARVRQRIERREETNVAVVGGGLTSAQVVDLAVSRGASKVWLFMRGPLKVKPFDVDLPWIGKYKNLHKSVFWTSDDPSERREMIAVARNGGSITPTYAKILRHHLDGGHVVLCTHTTIVETDRDTASGRCCLTTNPPIPSLPPMDFVVYCTGSVADVAQLPCLQPLRERFHVMEETEAGGFAQLTDELALGKDLPCFVTGRLAALQLGPGAGNLEGAREGAERVAWGIGDWLGRRDVGERLDRFDLELESDNLYQHLRDEAAVEV